ncbi:Tetratricopeptide repeat protein 38 [Ananas comosus]|uniref:Tetratricopeptide repeat protein 38 n=1 Tax=Ananas comosus TaxID=4615 RepID=A0A199W716_ANACO|nr:Tetratricopeptide repeat protein 38 [Ananas comosus]
MGDDVELSSPATATSPATEKPRRDRWGHPVRTASAACAAAIDAYYEAVLAYGRGRVAAALRAPLLDPSCALANALAAHALASQNPTRASSLLAAAANALGEATSYERMVFRAISCLMGSNKDEDAAIQMHVELLKEFPKDLVSLKRAQILCFYMGRADISLELVEQVLPQNENQNYIYGMLAFSLLELGRMEDAETAARKGFEINKHDCWSQHALCHVLQYQCHFKEAIDFMESCSSSWTSCSSFMYTHNWWHVALCYLEGELPIQKVLEIYDCYILQELKRSDAEPGEVYLNALGLLLRVSVRGQMDCIVDRLTALVTALKDESTWHMEWLLDILALWALASTKETQQAENLLKSMRSRISSMSEKKQQTMQRAIPYRLIGDSDLACRSIYEYGRDEYHKVFDILGPEFDATHYKMIGASDEQLDVFNEVWYSVLLETGQTSKAINEIENKVTKIVGTPFLWRTLSDVLENVLVLQVI